MSWSRKELPTPFDNQPLEGFSFLSGDMLAELYKQAWLKGQKYPMISYQSGLKRELQASQDLGRDGYVHIYGLLRLPVNQPFAETYKVAVDAATQLGFNLIRVGETTFEVWRQDLGGRYQIIHNQDSGHIANVSYIPGEPLSRRFPRAMELLDDVSRAVLPPLYTNETGLGLDAYAPVKFFTPDSNWTWYASEFDGDDLFFGLVSGFEVEFGYFSLTELEGVRGSLGLPIERDLFYSPQTLRDLSDIHLQVRRE